MPQKLKRLSVSDIRKLSKGTHADGGNLYLRVSDGGSSSWIFRYKSNGGVRQLGLGSSKKLSLANARIKAAWYRAKLASGDPIISPLAARKATSHGQSFESCATAYIQSKAPEWKNQKHKQQWINTLETYAFPIIGSMSVDRIGLGQVQEVLNPIWFEKTETATRVRSRIENILDYAHVKGFRGAENPARWRGNLDKVLPAASKIAKVSHFAALEYDQLSKLITYLESSDSQTSRCLIFTILTAVRSGEARNAEWSEIDFDKAVWNIPGEKMKNGKPHRVPLTDASLKLLRSLRRIPGQTLVFPSDRGSALSDSALSKTLHRYFKEATVHGMRSSFRQWCAERTSVPDSVCELALAHTPRDKLQATYQRSDLFEKRRELMKMWSEHLYSGG